MCGIVGIVALRGSPSPDVGQIRRMCDSILHRGPDEEGIHVEDGVGLGMRRLAIIDIDGGQQPIFNEDRTVRTVFNGEIYNFRELRSKLQAKGHTFKTNCDTEVIVHAYEEYGDDFPNHLNGMFAIALYDKKRKRLLLIRDQLGIKPLFYTATDDAVIWGSEIKAILASGKVQRELNPDGVLEFLSWEYVPGEGTLFGNIHKLPPGHMLVITANDGMSAPRQYWDIPTDNIESSGADESEWLGRLDDALKVAVQRQLVSDVPLGAFLSGGVDSSLVAAAMNSPETFSIGFDDPSYNELAFSKEVAQHLGTRHTTRVVDSKVVSLFDDLMYHLDDPIGDFSIFPTYLVSKLAREQVTVSLSGDGGDELFGGYETYVAQQLAEKYAVVPRPLQSLIASVASVLPPTSKKKGLINKIKRFTEGQSYPDSLGHARWRIFLNDVLRQSLFTPEFAARFERPAGHHIEELFSNTGGLSGTNRCLYVDAKSYMSDNCLVKVDRMSMAVSLEVRVPFLDVELVELAFSMPNSLKLAGGETKYLLKKLAAKYVPERSVYRPKEGFSIPIKNWLAGQFRPILDKYTDANMLRQQGIFDPLVVGRLVQEHLANKANHSHVLWSIIVFQAWYDMWLTGRADNAPKFVAAA